jgi:hypothetical protein
VAQISQVPSTSISVQCKRGPPHLDLKEPTLLVLGLIGSRASDSSALREGPTPYPTYSATGVRLLYMTRAGISEGLRACEAASQTMLAFVCSKLCVCQSLQAPPSGPEASAPAQTFSRQGQYCHTWWHRPSQSSLSTRVGMGADLRHPENSLTHLQLPRSRDHSHLHHLCSPVCLGCKLGSWTLGLC